VLLDWRDRSDRTSRTDRRFSAESFLSLKEHYLVATHLAHRREIAIWGAGPIGKAWAVRLQNRRIHVRYFVDLDPRKIGQRIHGAAVIAASEIERLRGVFLVVAVGALGRCRDGDEIAPPAREEIRCRLRHAGFVEPRDFVCVA
jgi:hypothetical protein